MADGYLTANYRPVNTWIIDVFGRKPRWIGARRQASVSDNEAT